MIFRKVWREIPKALQLRKDEILGEIDARGRMQDCVYNSMLAGEVAPAPTLDVEHVKELIPKNLPRKLKSYQLADLSKSLGRRYVFNINKPGYGKTLETILWMRLNLTPPFQVLILCPKTVIETAWYPQLNLYWPNWQKEGMFWITNYEQLYSEQRFKLACEMHWDCIVLDESHTIKSFSSKITQRVFKLHGDARHCLTGTPVKNRPEDLAAQLKWLDPSSITTYTEFQFAFCDMRRDAWGWKANGLTKDKKRVEQLQRLLDLYCVGGEEHDIGAGGLPERVKVRLKMDSAVKKLYRQTVGEYDSETKRRVIDTAALLEQGVKISNAIEAATRRQQIASNPQLFDARFKNVKFDWIINWMRGTEEKVIIMSKFAETISALENTLKCANLSFACISREMGALRRKQVIDEWKNSKQALLGTFGVLATGTDGLQDACHYEIHIDRNWDHADNDQAERRIYRTGQGGRVVIYILQAIGTIDIQIENVQWQKGRDANVLLRSVGDEEV